MARSFAAGRGMLHLGLHQWHYAPLYSVVISPAFWFGGRPFLAISAINIFTAWAMVAGTYVWAKKYLPRGAPIIAGLVGINIGLWDVCREPRSETLFSALLIWTAVLFSKSVDARNFKKFLTNLLFGTLLLTAAVCARQVGIFLAGGLTVAMVIRWSRSRVNGGRILLVVLSGVVVSSAVIALIVRDHHAAQMDHAPVVVTYLEQYRQPGVTMPAQLLDGVRRQTADVGRLLIPGMWGSFAHFGQWFNFNSIFYALLTVPVLIGWWHITRRTADPLLWTFPFYAAMFVVWPFDQGTRFNVPMLPVLWVSVWSMLDRWALQRRQITGAIFFLHLIASLIYLARDVAIVSRWNQKIPAMKIVADKVGSAGPVVAAGGAPNDALIWRYLIDRPVVAIPSLSAATMSGAQWVLQPVSARSPDGFFYVARSTSHCLFEHTPVRK